MHETSSYSFSGKRVFVAGHRGMVGSAIMRRLAREDCEILTAPRGVVDLRSASEVKRWMDAQRPQAVFVAAARVGGIHANNERPAEFLYDNLMIEANLIEASRQHRVEKLLFLGSSCIYPRLAPQPLEENQLLSGPLEPTNQWYAIAKIAGIKLVEAYRRQYGCDYISAMPTNLYGPGDNFDLMSSHVLPALIAKAHRAKFEKAAALELWGTGTAKREFLHADDMADAAIHLMKTYSGDEHINVGVGTDMSIADLAALICEIVGFRGALRFDPDKPDGTPRKLLDVSRMTELGWTARIPLEEGIADAYRWYLDNVAPVRLDEHAPA
jgi:GDP-L-fucose synthase